MNAPQAAIQSAHAVAKWLATELYDLPIDASLRNRLSGGCLSVCQDHQCAITLLLDEHFYASAFALVRPQYESYVRGLWLAHCATDKQISGFSCAKEPPKLGEMLSTIEKQEAYDAGTLSRFKLEMWSALCSYTHTGGLQVQRWQTKSGVESNYPPEEICEVARVSASFALLSGIGMAALAKNDALANRLLERMHSFANEA